MDKSTRVNIVGLGPGNHDYITPRALKIIKESDVVIGGSRNLQGLKLEDKKTLNITSDLETIIEYIKSNYYKEKITVVVSGDTGFYSFLNYLKENVNIQLNVVPGISSLQYMFSIIQESWHDGYLGSCHGRELNLIELVTKYSKIGLLTDKIWTPQRISKELIKAGLLNKVVYVGENLSYENERIVWGSPLEISNMDDFSMCVVVIIDGEKME